MKNQKVDIICQHTHDGTIIPLKVRVIDEDGEYQTFHIKAYKCLSLSGEYLLPNEERVTSNHIKTFECKIIVLNSEKVIKLVYNTYEGCWKLYYR